MLGAWFGGKKPDFKAFLRPLAVQLNKLRAGVNMNTPIGEIPISFSTLTMTADNQAKEAVVNYQSTVCGICQQVPEFVENAVGLANVPTFPFRQQPAPLRTRHNMVALGQQAVQQQEPVNGLKGGTPLLWINNLDPVLPIDYQHNVCLRVMAKLLSLWFGEAGAGKEFSRKNHVDAFDKLLKDTRPPSFITRPPRPYTKYIKYWKAVEYRNFLLYYGPIVLRTLLPDDLFRHFLLLSGGIRIFLGPSISIAESARGQEMLNLFVKQFEDLYDGRRYISKTVHSLVHVELCVLKTGPLWATSCFPFESTYHFLVKMIHGTRFVLHQVRSSFLSEKQNKTKQNKLTVKQ